MEEGYGLQDQRSSSVAFMVVGLRGPNSSSGFVSALTYKRRYSPGLSASCCAICSGAMTASSSGPPLERIPVSVKETLRSEDLSCRRSPGLRLARVARDFPTMGSGASSVNQRPSTCHQELVCSIPVTYARSSGTATACRAQVPMSVVLITADHSAFPGVAATGTSIMGAKPTILLRQKIVLSLPKSRSGRYAPEFAAR